MSSGQALQRPKRGEIQAVVHLLDGKEYRSNFSSKITGQALVDDVLKQLDIEEKDYFSLYFKDSNHRIFIDHDKQLKKQLEESTYEGPEGKWATWNVSFGVKYYVRDPTHLKEELTRYYYCLQVCQDIRERRIIPNKEVNLELMALLIQSSAGDYDPLEHKPGYTEEFTKFLYETNENLPVDLEMAIVEQHKEKSGLTPERAEFQFLSIAKKLHRYGSHLFAVMDANNTTMILGVNAGGIQMWNHTNVADNYAWPDIAKISYKRSRFRVRHIPPEAAGKKSQLRIIDYSCADHRAAKRLWRACIDQHTFFRLRDPPPRPRIPLPFVRNRYGFSGRTLDQMIRADKRKTEPHFNRTWSGRYNRAREVHCYDCMKRNWFPGDEQWFLKPHPLSARAIAERNYRPGQVIIRFLLKGMESPFDRAEKQIIKYHIGKKEGEQSYSVASLGRSKQLGRQRGQSASTTPTSTLQRTSSHHQEFGGSAFEPSPNLTSPTTPTTPTGKPLPPGAQPTMITETHRLSQRSRSRSLEPVASPPQDPTPYAVLNTRRGSRESKSPPAVAPKPKSGSQYAKIQKKQKSASPPTSPPPPPPEVISPDKVKTTVPISELFVQSMESSQVQATPGGGTDLDFSILDEDDEPKRLGATTITVTSKKTAGPPPPQRTNSSSEAAAALAVKVSSPPPRPPPPLADEDMDPPQEEVDSSNQQPPIKQYQYHEDSEDVQPEMDKLAELLQEVSQYNMEETARGKTDHNEMEAQAVREFLRREYNKVQPEEML